MNNQAFYRPASPWDYQPGKDNVKDPPEGYHFWKNYLPDLTPPWSGKLLDLSYSDPRTLAPKTVGIRPQRKEPGWGLKPLELPADHPSEQLQGRHLRRGHHHR